MKSQTLGDMNTNVQYDKPMPSKEKMKTGDCCGNRRGEKIGSEESSIRTWNRREKFTGSEESSRKVYRVRGFVDQEWKSSTRTRNRRPGPRICRPGVEIVDQVRDFIDRVRGVVDQELKSSTGTENSSTRTAECSTRTMNGDENLSG